MTKSSHMTSSIQEYTNVPASTLSKIHLILHYEELVQHFGNLVKDNTEMQEMINPTICIGRCRV